MVQRPLLGYRAGLTGGGRLRNGRHFVPVVKKTTHALLSLRCRLAGTRRTHYSQLQQSPAVSRQYSSLLAPGCSRTPVALRRSAGPSTMPPSTGAIDPPRGGERTGRASGRWFTGSAGAGQINSRRKCAPYFVDPRPVTSAHWRCCLSAQLNALPREGANFCHRDTSVFPAGRNARIFHTMSRAEKIGELGHCPIMCSL